MKRAEYDEMVKSLAKIIIAKYPYLTIEEILKEFNEQKKACYNSQPLCGAENFIKCYIKSLLSSSNYLNIVNRFVDYKVRKYKNVGIIELLEWLSNFLIENGFELTPNKIKMIFKNNEFLSLNMEKFIYNNLDNLKNGNIKNVINNDVVILFIEVYCAFNNIDIEEKYELDGIDEEITTDDIYYSDSMMDTILHEIKQYELLSVEETNELIKQYKNGDLEAKSKLVYHNLRLVLFVARKYINRGVDIIDLFQEGTTGLMRAIDLFDLTVGCKLSTYAILWIRQTITTAILNTGRAIKLPHHIQIKFGEYLEIKNKLETKYMRNVSNEEIASIMKISLKELEEILGYYNSEPISLDAKANVDDSDIEFSAFVASSESLEDEFFERDKTEQIIKLLKKANLNEREIDVLIRRNGLITGETETLEKIGKSYGVKRERIRQIENKALLILRRSSVISDLAEYAQNPEKCLSDAREMAGGLNNGEQYGINGVKKEKVFVKKITVYEYLKGFDKASIDSLIKKLSPMSKEILRIRFGDDLNKPSHCVCLDYDFNEKVNLLLSYMKRFLKNPNYVPKTTPIYSYFNVDYALVDLAISYLSKDELNLLFFKYGNDFHKPSYNIDWEYDRSNEREFMKIIDKIHLFVTEYQKPFIKFSASKRLIINNLYHLFKGFSREEINRVIGNLSERDLGIIKSKFGEDLNRKIRQNNLSQNDIVRYFQVLRNIRTALETHKFSKVLIQEDVINKISIYDKSIIEDILRNLPEDLQLSEVEVFLLNAKFGDFGKFYSLEEMANLLKVSEIEIVNITRTAILKVKKYLMDKVNSEMDVITSEMKSNITLCRKNKC